MSRPQTGITRHFCSKMISKMPSNFSRLTRNASETQALGREIGARLYPGDLILLRGELGAGKTTLVQGVAQALGIAEVSSPTFVLIVEHPGGLPLLHLD